MFATKYRLPPAPAAPRALQLEPHRANRLLLECSRRNQSQHMRCVTIKGSIDILPYCSKATTDYVDRSVRKHRDGFKYKHENKRFRRRRRINAIVSFQSTVSCYPSFVLLVLFSLCPLSLVFHSRLLGGGGSCRHNSRASNTSSGSSRSSSSIEATGSPQFCAVWYSRGSFASFTCFLSLSRSRLQS